jgi:hypothetical protein
MENKKLIPIEHHLASGCCMWSGIEDIYAMKTHQQLPEAFLFALSSFGETCLISTGQKDMPYMFGAADGRTRKTYGQIQKFLGLEYRISEGRTLEYALSTIKKEIDQGRPVLLGPLDMYHLPYLKMYHTDHIPMHYVLLAGYDAGSDMLYIYDCDRQDLLPLPQAELIRAWQIEDSPVGKKNGFIRFSLSDTPPDRLALAKQCLAAKAERQLCPKPDFVGVSAYARLARILPKWKAELSPENYRAQMASLASGLGMVPKVPNAILGVEGPDISYQANYDRLGRVLLSLGSESGKEEWTQAGNLFLLCGKNCESMEEKIVQTVRDGEDHTDDIAALLRENGSLAEKAYTGIQKAAR